MYCPLLNSYLNNSTVVIDIPFSFELKYKTYQIIPFLMNFNGPVYTVETNMIKPINYIISTDSMKESKIIQDDLQERKGATVNLYLYTRMFTLKEALSNSCEPSLVKNICSGKLLFHTSKISTTHTIFPLETRVSMVCPNLESKVAAVYELYRVPHQCDLHAPGLSTTVNRQNTFLLKKEDILLEINSKMSNTTKLMEIRRLNKHCTTRNVGQGRLELYYLWIIPIIATLVLVILESFTVTVTYRNQ